MRNPLVASLILLAGIIGVDLRADTTWMYAVQISATVQTSPARITLSWPQDPNGANSYTVYRKAKEDTSWGSGTTLSGSTLSYVDNNVSVGSAYEYRIVKSATLGYYTGYGYIYVGVNAPLTESRGKLVLIVDNSFSTPLASELARLQTDLVGDGWTVLRHDVARSDTPDSVRNLTRADYNADPQNVKAVFLFGHVPILRCGNLNIDGHQARPLPADGFYGDMDGAWNNQSYLPSDVELMVGRVDLANLPGTSASSPWPSEQELLRNYLNKDHRWRNKEFTVPQRAIIGNRFGDFNNEGFAASGFRNFTPFVGANIDIANEQDSAPVNQKWSTMMAANSYLWSYGCGGGSYSSMSGMGTNGAYNDVTSYEIMAEDSKAVFFMMFGSWLGEWDSTDDIMRTALALPSMGLTCSWAGRPHWYYHHFGLGEPIGYSARLTMNNSSTYENTVNQFTRGIHIALMGDPTLRMHPVYPPANVSGTMTASGANLSWTASTDTNLQGYHVYRATTPTGPFTRVSSSLVNATTFTDTSVSSGTYTYMIRAIKLENTPSGTYFNPSQGAFFTFSGTGSSSPVVSIVATDANAAEAGPDPGTFTVTRTGPTTSPLTVNYTTGGTAANGIDYNSVSGSVTIPAGATSAAITVTPINDTQVEGPETVVLTLASGSGYTIGSPASASITISDNMQPGPSGSVNLMINATAPGVSGPVCVRAIIQQSNGSYVSGEWGSPGWPAITMRGKAVAPDTVIQVPTGLTTITVGKGPDYYPQTIVTNLSIGGGTYTINFALQPVLDMLGKGWIGGEAHAHFFHGEGEISRTPSNTWAMAAAGGLNFVSMCEDHLGSGVMTRQQMLDAWTPFDNSECQMWIGVEEPKNVWGHNIALLSDPWAIRSAPPYHWGIHSIHQQGGVSIPVHTDRLFPGRYYDDSSTGTRTWFLFPNNNYHKAFAFDALVGNLIDAWSGVSDEGTSSIKMPPYFKLLDMGYRIPFTADSDFCFDRVNNGGKALGCWVTYYQLDGQPLTRASAINAIKKGRIMATTGPLVNFSIDDALPGDTLPADGATRTVRIEASHAFNPWTLGLANVANNDTAKISQVDLFRNGQVIKTWTPNTTNAVLTYTINETSTNSYYMVRVAGNSSTWMAAYASPIYFDNAVRPRQPETFKSLVQGRLYDSATGTNLTGTVSCVQYGVTNWTIPTDTQGRFQAHVPLDSELVACDQFGRQFMQNFIQQESVYAFCTYSDANYLNNMAGSIDGLKSIVQTMRWEFPMGYQPAASYVKTALSGDATMSNFSILSAPSPTAGKSRSEIVMLIADKTRVQAGDTVNYAVIYRQPQGQTPSENLNVEVKAWDPSHPRMYNKLATSFHWNESASALVNLGGGFYLRQGSFVAPDWAANSTETTAAIKFFVTVRYNGSILEEANLLIPMGPTKRELLVSTTSDGFPASWGERGIGPCNFFREWTFLIRYADYRTMGVSFNLNGQQITVRPTVDTAHNADADDAVFYDQFYYDGQCEPQYRNVPFRDAVRTQPPPTDFSSVPIYGGDTNVPPPDTTAPTVALSAPANGATVSGTTVQLTATASDNVGIAGVQFQLDGANVRSEVLSAPYTQIWDSTTVTNGFHRLSAIARDAAGNRATSALISITVTNSSGTITNINTNTLTGSDYVWVEDAIPYGADWSSNGGDSWNWVNANPPPYSGNLAHQSTGANLQEHLFNHAWLTMNVNTGEFLFCYIYLNSANPPSEVMLQWTDGSWEHRAYWGANQINYGTAGTASRRYIGPLPAAGRWVRLEVPASIVGLEGASIRGMSFALYGGQATWDCAGKSSRLIATATKSPNGVTLTWNSQPSQTYQIWYKTDLTQTNWTALTQTIATNTTTTWTDPSPSDTQRFYRITTP